MCFRQICDDLLGVQITKRVINITESGDIKGLIKKRNWP
jgi:hypothetical protein